MLSKQAYDEALQAAFFDELEKIAMEKEAVFKWLGKLIRGGSQQTVKPAAKRVTQTASRPPSFPGNQAARQQALAPVTDARGITHQRVEVSPGVYRNKMELDIPGVTS